MNPTQSELQVICPQDGQKVSVQLESLQDGRRSVSKCSQFGEGAVTCAQQCLGSAPEASQQKRN